MPADPATAGAASLAASEPRTTITTVLRKPHVGYTVAASIIARLSYGAMVLLVVLRVTETGHSYGDAGVASAAYATAMAIVSPLLSRIIDRTGQTRVLLTTAISGAVATSALALAPSGTPLGVLVLLSLFNGALQPPVSGVMRALWETLIEREDERHIGYAVEAGAIELVFTGGPLVIVGGIAGAFGASVALLVAAALTAAGTTAFALSGPSRRWRPSPHRHANPIGALRSRGVHTLMIVSAGCGGGFGAIEIGVTAFGREHHAPALVGVLLSFWAIGSLFGGIAISRVKPAADPGRRIALILALMGIGNASFGLWSSPYVFAVVLFVVGWTIAPTFATANATMGGVAPAGTMTEAFAFTLSALMVGSMFTAPIAGALVDHVSPAAALSFAGALPAIAAVLVWLRRATLEPVAGSVAAAERADALERSVVAGADAQRAPILPAERTPDR